MARPKSEEKRHAILDAATNVFAEQGIGAPTSRIAKEAGIAEGSLFTYFATKDVLLNELYLVLKAELRDVMMPGYPLTESPRNRAWHTWQALVDWGVVHPRKRQVMDILGLSDRLTDHSKTAGALAFAPAGAMLTEIVENGPMRALPTAFVGALLASMAEATMDCMARDHSRHEQFRLAGFEAFWRAVGQGN
ncbi:TetR/AcrR family transcriptional regulator [Janthinobacterium agaricidamnosum]|uniref:Bacterial regulatory s, tetR family protein n=1 Tax=Janthinobacterium agaricidamnosum NBRC 102515 = DSM 9628 TaxID=1349767 RepID=W0VAF8_9BURK|nr:TetR/AcrR family transcriptional regulator [Janthinobacterium agaricidamnosum]CDG84252.1 bacterial regulatory s, tetR family protein [Janthinobacterium agaricidamnosum NBRC 102515 = DSM 9628]